MRFVAGIREFNNVVLLKDLLHTLSRSAPSLIMRILPETILFIFKERQVFGQEELWVQFHPSVMFQEFSMVGLDENHDDIIFEFIVDHLIRALQSAETSLGRADYVRFKLRQKDFSTFLALMFDLPTSQGTRRSVTHEIPIRLLKVNLWRDYQIVPTADFDVSFYLPSIEDIRYALEQLKSTTEFVTFYGNDKNELRIQARTDSMRLCSFFRYMDRPIWNSSDDQPLKGIVGSHLGQQVIVDTTPMPDRAMEITAVPFFVNPEDPGVVAVHVNLKSLINCLCLPKFKPEKVVCNLKHAHMMQLFMRVGDIQLQYCIPSSSLL